MRVAADFFFAARPMLHLPIWSVYLVSLHYHNLLSAEQFGPSDLAMLALISLMAAAAYYLNQIHDYDSDAINRKLGFLQRGYIGKDQMRKAGLICSLLALVGAALYSFFIFQIFVQSLVLSYLYSVKPFRLKDRAIAGMIANAYAFGWLIPFTVMSEMDMHNNDLLGWCSPVYFFLTVAAIHILTTLPDREGDQSTGKRTIGVVLHPVAAMTASLILSGLAAWVAFRSGRLALTWLAVASVAAIAAALLSRSARIILAAAKSPILLLTLLAGWHYPGYLLFIVVLLFLTRVYYRRRFDMVYPRLT